MKINIDIMRRRDTPRRVRVVVTAAALAGGQLVGSVPVGTGHRHRQIVLVLVVAVDALPARIRARLVSHCTVARLAWRLQHDSCTQRRLDIGQHQHSSVFGVGVAP